jgi:hypothetical protein
LEIAMQFIDDLADNIENMDSDISYVGNPCIVGKEWAFEVATLGNRTTLITRYASVSRTRTDAARNDLIAELDARGIEVVEVDYRVVLRIEGSASVTVH